MSSSGFAATLAFERGHPRALLSAVLCAWLAGGPGVLAAVDHPVALAVVLSAIIGCRIDVRRPTPTLRLWWRGEDDRRLHDPPGPPGPVGGSTSPTLRLIPPVLRGPARTVRIPIARDAVDPAVWRRLRVRLRTSGASPVEDSA